MSPDRAALAHEAVRALLAEVLDSSRPETNAENLANQVVALVEHHVTTDLRELVQQIDEKLQRTGMLDGCSARAMEIRKAVALDAAIRHLLGLPQPSEGG